MQWTPVTQGHFRTVYRLAGVQRGSQDLKPQLSTFVSPKLVAGAARRTSECEAKVFIGRLRK